jgi:hypothetical protein
MNKSTIYNLFYVLIYFFAFATGVAAAEPRSVMPMIIDVNTSQQTELWRITNDGVMGGRSQGRLIFKEDHGVFTGNISLDNNGGFSSVFRYIEQLQSGYDTITVDVEGDGQKYQLRLVIYYNGYRLAYKHDFETLAGERQNLSFNLSDFKATFRGRTINNAPALQSRYIKEVGFLMTKKRPGQFDLSVFSLVFT